jgi:hypothetical protein
MWSGGALPNYSCKLAPPERVLSDELIAERPDATDKD